MLNSEEFALNCSRIVCQQEHYNMSKEALQSCIGVTAVEVEKIYKKHLGQDFDYQAFRNKKKIVEDEYIKDHPIMVKKGLIDLLEFLKANNIKMAVATSTYKQKATQRLKETEIYHYFDYLVFGDDITESKPHPQIFLKALNHFGFDPSEAIVFEDSYNGLLAADAGNIKCIIIPDICIIPKEILNKAYKVYPDLSYGIQEIRDLNN